MKYIDAELLRKEIERHLERATAEQEKFPDMPKYRWYLREGKKELCNDLLDYMYDALGVEEPITDSLQQEQPCDTCTNDKGCVTCKDGELWEGKEQSCEGYDEAYLNEKIAKASKTWEGVDVDKYMAEMRGYEQPSEDLEKAADTYAEKHDFRVPYDGSDNYYDEVDVKASKEAFIAGAEWQKEQDQPITGNSLEKEWLRYVDKKKKECRGELPSLGDYGWLQIARHFAEWQKQQMLKDAVDVKVVENYGCEKGENGEWRRVITPTISFEVANLSIGDKVKVIIVPIKEEKR